MLSFRLVRPPRPLFVALVVFLLAGVAATVMIRRGEQHDRLQERTQVANMALDHADVLQRNIERALSATYALAALVRQGNGAISNFDAVGRQMLPFYPGVSSLSLAPGGVIRSVVPLVGNEKIIGQDLLNHPQTKREAAFARNSGKLTLVGPFTLVQGEVALIGRLPIFLDDATGKPFFWGFINVVIGFPDAIEAAGLPQLAGRGIAYKLRHIRPDTGEERIIAAASPAPLIDPVEHTLDLPYGIWTLSAAPVAGWGDALRFSLKAALGLLFCLLLAYVAKLLVESRAHERGLEALVSQRTAELQAREADLNRAQAVARVGSWVLDFTRKKFQASTEALRIVGVSAGATFNFEDFLQRVHPDDRSTVDRARQAVSNGEPYDIEFRVMTDAAIRWVHSYAELTVEADGTQRRALGTVQDITERKRHEEGLQNFRMAMDASADAIYLVDRTTMRFVDVNEAACRMQNRTREELLALGPDGVLSIPREELARSYDSIIAGGAGTEPIEILRERENGTQVWVELRRRAQRSGDGWMIVTTVRDITEHKLTEERVQRVAHHDSLTGLPNRLLFNDRLQQAISLAKRDARQFALLFLDLDKFKPVNDSLGHAVGDELLQAVAARIRQQVRESDTVARIGGDEFTVILSNVTRREDAQVVAGKIIAAIAAPFQLGSQQHSVTIGTSIGITIYPADAGDTDALIKAADAAMYRAKQVGGSFRFCDV